MNPYHNWLLQRFVITLRKLQKFSFIINNMESLIKLTSLVYTFKFKQLSSFPTKYMKYMSLDGHSGPSLVASLMSVHGSTG